MIITKNGKHYTLPTDYKTTVEDNFVTIRIGYNAKKTLNKSEVAKLIALLTKLISE